MTRKHPAPFGDLGAFFDHVGDLGIGHKEHSFGRHSINLDVFETDDAVTVTADAPGYDKDNINVHLIHHDVVRIELHADDTDSASEVDAPEMFIHERVHGSASRTIQLPSRVSPDTATAEYHNGVLEITFEMLTTDRTDIVVN
jgi:HSP20 family protein